jgi:WS/DGAT/MGAT family acyltransferase
MLGDEVWRRATGPLRMVGGAVSAMGRPRQALDAAFHTASGFAETLTTSLTPASQTPFNVPTGPHRRFDWTRFDMALVREVKQKVGGTVNDVVLACVAGAVRWYLKEHEVALSEIDFRTFVPVSTRKPEQRGKLGNQVSLLVAHLPVDEVDPRRRLEKVVEETRQLKQSDQIAGTQAIEEISDMTAVGLLTQFSRLAAARRAYNMVVTNVPGPPVPVFLDGARLVASYPLVPLFTNQALGIALFSYDGFLHWGFNSDWDALDDLHDFVLAIEREFELLRKL